MMFLYGWPLWLIAAAITGVSVAYGVSAIFIGRALGWSATHESNDTAGFRHAFVGVVYAVALALIVVNVQAAYDRVEEAVLAEASSAMSSNVSKTRIGPTSTMGVEKQPLCPQNRP